MDPRSWTSSPASRVLSASASARLKAAAACWFGALSRVFRFLPETRQLVLAGGEFQSKARQFALHLTAAVRRGNDLVLRFALLRINFLERLFRRTQLRGRRFERGLLFAHLPFEPHHLGVERAQFALHSQRTG